MHFSLACYVDGNGNLKTSRLKGVCLFRAHTSMSSCMVAFVAKSDAYNMSLLMMVKLQSERNTAWFLDYGVWELIVPECRRVTSVRPHI